MSTTNINIPKPVIDYNDLENLPTLVTEHSELNLDDGTNPHGTTKSDVGLSNVDNTSDLDKPISSATQTALDLKLNGSGTTSHVPFFSNANTLTSANELSFNNSTKALSVIGSMGIGTNAPAFPIDVQGASAGLNMIRTGGTDTFVRLNSGANNTTITQIRSTPTGNLNLVTNDTSTRMTVTQAGNVGIGTNTPTERLHVIGNTLNETGFITARNLNTTNQFRINPMDAVGPKLQLGTTANPISFWEMGAYNSQNNFDNKDRDFQIFGNGITGIMVKQATGNVGIGTTTPSAELQVMKTNAATSLFIGNNSTGKTYGIIKTSADTNGFLDISSVRTSGSVWGDIVLNQSGGNVGIGTTTPSERLHVNGRLRLTTIDNGVGDVSTISPTGIITRRTSLQLKSDIGLGNVDNTSDLNKPISTATQTALNNKQDTLVSGTNIKTVNGNSLLGSGNITTADVNPTSGVYPINETGSFVDSKLSVYDSQNNTRQIQQPNVINKIGLFTDANNGQSSLTPGSGIELGVANLNPDWFGTDTFSDCSIVSAMGEPGFFGSSLHIKTQPQIQSIPAPFNTQKTQISIVPGNFMNGNFGIGIKTETPNCPITVFSDNGFPQPGHNNYAIARFDWDMGAIVFPKVDSFNQAMMMAEEGMVLYNTTLKKLQVYDGGTWIDLH